MGSCLSQPSEKPLKAGGGHMNGGVHFGHHGVGPVLPANLNIAPSPAPTIIGYPPPGMSEAEAAGFLEAHNPYPRTRNANPSPPAAFEPQGHHSHSGSASHSGSSDLSSSSKVHPASLFLFLST